MNTRYWLIFLLLLVSCGSVEKKDRAEKRVPVEVMEISVTDSISNDYYVGVVDEHRFSSLSFSVIGTVREVYRTMGDRVSKGELLAELDSSSYYEAYRIAQVALAQAQDGYERMKLLYDGGTLPEVQWVDINTKLAQAKATERIAFEKLSATRIRAPFDGVVSMRSCEPGEVAVAAVPVMKIVDLKELCVKISVPEREIAQVGRKIARVRIPAAEKEMSGAVDVEGVTPDPISHTYAVKIRVDNPDETLRPGMLAEVYLQKEVERFVCIPANIVQISHDGRRFVWVVQDGRAQRRFIQVGRSYASGVEVVDGLSVGDRVIARGSHKVSQGMAVEII